MHELNLYWMIVLGASIAIFLLFSGIRFVPQTHRGIIEQLGKYARFTKPGVHWIIPGIQKMIKINIKEQMMYTEPQEFITDDNRSIQASSLVYFKVKEDKFSVIKFRYEHSKFYEWRIINLAQKSLRSVISNTKMSSLKSDINLMNKELQSRMYNEAVKLGINIVRTEIREMDLQPDMKEIMTAGNIKEFVEDNFPSTAKTCTE